MLSVSVRPPFCPSVTLVHCIQTAEDIVKLLSLPGSTIIILDWFDGWSTLRVGWSAKCWLI